MNPKSPREQQENKDRMQSCPTGISCQHTPAANLNLQTKLIRSQNTRRLQASSTQSSRGSSGAMGRAEHLLPVLLNPGKQQAIPQIPLFFFFAKLAPAFAKTNCILVLSWMFLHFFMFACISTSTLKAEIPWRNFTADTIWRKSSGASKHTVSFTSRSLRLTPVS